MIASAINAYLRHGEQVHFPQFSLPVPLFVPPAAELIPESAVPGNFTRTDHGHAANHHIIKINSDIAVFLFAQQFQQINKVLP